MAVITVENDSAWAAKHAESTDKTIVVDFSATWCGPCKMISPFFEELSLKYPNLVFLKVDVDACQGVAAECGIAAMPTFQVWKNGAKLEECVGANKTKLEEMIARYAA